MMLVVVWIHFRKKLNIHFNNFCGGGGFDGGGGDIFYRIRGGRDTF